MRGDLNAKTAKLNRIFKTRENAGAKFGGSVVANVNGSER